MQLYALNKVCSAACLGLQSAYICAEDLQIAAVHVTSHNDWPAQLQHVTRHLNNDLINDVKLGDIDSELSSEPTPAKMKCITKKFIKVDTVTQYDISVPYMTKQPTKLLIVLFVNNYFILIFQIYIAPITRTKMFMTAIHTNHI